MMIDEALLFTVTKESLPPLPEKKCKHHQLLNGTHMHARVGLINLLP
jgi:hypothetical protein